jgi:LEA14-like dessication related protein
MRSKLLPLLTTLAACATAQPKPTESAPEIHAESLTVTDQTLTGFSVSAKLMVTNSSASNWTVTGASEELWVEGSRASSDTPTLNQTVPAGGTAEVEVPASAEPIKDEAELRSWDARADKPIELLMKGELHINDGAGTRNLPFSRVGELRAPRLPIAKMDYADVSRYDGGDIGIAFFLGLENQNTFPVHVKSITYTATLAGKQVADGVATSGDKLPPSQISEYEIDSKLDRGEGGAEVTKLAESGQLSYQLDGVADFGIAKVPIHLSGLLSFTKKGEGHHKPNQPASDAPAKPADDQ